MLPARCKRHPVLTAVLAWVLVMTPVGKAAEAAFSLERADGSAPTTGLRFLPEVIGMRTQPPPVYRPLRASGAATGRPVTILEPASRWDCIAKYESGDRALPCNPYCSRLQWLPSTWRAAGGTRYAPTPQQATKEQEYQIADEWLARTSWGQWPQTSRRCGYR
jgi:hypothetical protein